MRIDEVVKAMMPGFRMGLGYATIYVIIRLSCRAARLGTRAARTAHLKLRGYGWLSPEEEALVISRLSARQMSRVMRWEDLAAIPGLTEDTEWLAEVLRASTAKPGEPDYFGI